MLNANIRTHRPTARPASSLYHRNLAWWSESLRSFWSLDFFVLEVPFLEGCFFLASSSSFSQPSFLTAKHPSPVTRQNRLLLTAQKLGSPQQPFRLPTRETRSISFPNTPRFSSNEANCLLRIHQESRARYSVLSTRLKLPLPFQLSSLPNNSFSSPICLQSTPPIHTIPTLLLLHPILSPVLDLGSQEQSKGRQSRHRKVIDV